MKKIKDYLKFQWAKIRVWIWFLQRKNKGQMTGHGLYLFNYLVHKYIQEEDIEEIENYENVITGMENRLTKRPLPPNLTLHDISALMLSLTLFNSASEKDKKKCLSFFTIDEARDSFLTFYKKFIPLG